MHELGLQTNKHVRH